MFRHVLSRYREGRYPENMETVTVSNTSLMKVEASFCFQYDHNAATFLLDPPAMTLQPGESKVGGPWGWCVDAVVYKAK